jgi:nucleotide-binding universal stress UspA family protein
LRGFDRLMMGSATERVMRRAPCPVLAVREPPHESVAAGQPRHLYRILACTDFSEYSERNLNYAFSTTAEYDAELTLLHVLEEVPRSAKKEEVIVATTKQLDKLIPPEWRETLKIKTAVRIGKPYQQIIRFAEQEQSDVVTMGVRGRGALDVAVFGSTTYRVMQLGPCPVLAVRV